MQVEFGLLIVQQLKRTGKHRKLQGGSALLHRISLYQLMRRSWQHVRNLKGNQNRTVDFPVCHWAKLQVARIC